MKRFDQHFCSSILVLISFLLAACGGETTETVSQTTETTKKIPITSNSEEAIAAYITARDLNEKLRGIDARPYYEEAVALDENFALAHLGLANTSPTATEFFASLERAAEIEDISDGEHLIILAARAASDGDPESQRKHLTELVRAYPGDERAHVLLAGFHFGRQEFDQAIRQFGKATSIDAGFHAPYNMLGYANRALGNYEQAEAAFKTYTELLPDEPNPYDSYAELLMKLGRFDESIANYRKALENDEDFVASYVGIGNNHILLGDFESARESFSKLAAIARNDGQRRQAHFWKTVSYLHQDDYEAALAELEARYAIAAETDDKATLSADLNLIATVLMEKGDRDGAEAKYRAAVEMIDDADVSEDVKEGVHRNLLYFEGRVAVARGDLEAATLSGDAYRGAVEAKRIPFELWRSHELAGEIALARSDYETALIELGDANQQDPRVLYLQAVACKGTGDQEGLAANALAAADFNQLNLNLAFVRTKAAKLTES